MSGIKCQVEAFFFVKEHLLNLLLNFHLTEHRTVKTQYFELIILKWLMLQAAARRASSGGEFHKKYDRREARPHGPSCS